MKKILFLIFMHFEAQANLVFFTFPAEKNATKVPPISILYDFSNNNSVNINENTLRIDSIRATLVRYKKNNKIRFVWPKGLISEGDFIALDSAKKYLFKFKSSVFKTDNKSNMHQYNLDFEPEDFEKLKTNPFFSLCIQKTVQEGTLRFCTEEYFVSTQDKTIKLKSRSEYLSNPAVEINGNLAGLQGEILLNASTDFLNIKFISTKKSYLELDLTAPKFDILELSFETEETLKIKARGSLPVELKPTIIEKSISSWEALIPKSTESINIQGSSGLKFKATLPKISSEDKFLIPKVTVLSGNLQTSASFAEVVFKLDQKYSIQLSDSKNQTIHAKNGQWIWRINNIKPGLNNFEIQISEEKENWIAVIQIERLQRHHTSILLGVPPWIQAEYRFDWSDRWISMIQGQRQFTNQATNPLNQQLLLDTKFKLKPSYFLSQPAWSLGLYFSINNYSYEGQNFTSQAFGLSADTQIKNSLLLSEKLPWLKAAFIIPFTNTSDLKIKNALQLQTTMVTANKTGLNYEFGFESLVAQYQLTENLNRQIFNLVLIGGITQSF